VKDKPMTASEVIERCKEFEERAEEKLQPALDALRKASLEPIIKRLEEVLEEYK